MKNIHLLPTDKQSKLHKIGNELGFTEIPNDNFIAIQLHVFVTNDEEIKEGDWFYEIRTRQSNVVKRKFEFTSVNENCKKIVLTNNNTLIENNVQEVDDDFLRWLVKNPTCEEVEVIKYEDNNSPILIKDKTFHYKITIPKEELNQETLEEAAKNYAIKKRQRKHLSNREFDLCQGDFINGAKWQHEQFFNDDRVKTLEKGMEYLLKRQETMFSGDEVYDILIHHTVELFKKEPITLEDFWNKFKK
jgi:hypothetical protein